MKTEHNVILQMFIYFATFSFCSILYLNFWAPIPTPLHRTEDISHTRLHLRHALLCQISFCRCRLVRGQRPQICLKIFEVRTDPHNPLHRWAGYLVSATFHLNRYILLPLLDQKQQIGQIFNRPYLHGPSNTYASSLSHIMEKFGVAKNTEPMVCSSIPNFTQIGAPSHYFGTRNHKFEILGYSRAPSLPTPSPIWNKVKPQTVMCSSMSNFTLIDELCRLVPGTGRRETANLPKFWGLPCHIPFTSLD